MNFGFSGEMIFIFLLALILFGPKKMPEIGRQVARLLGEFRRASNEFRSQIEAEVNSLEVGGKSSSNRQQILPPLSAPLGSLANRIFNPPSAEKLEAAESAAAQEPVAAKTGESAAAETSAPENISAVETGLAPSPARKAAPDA